MPLFVASHGLRVRSVAGAIENAEWVGVNEIPVCLALLLREGLRGFFLPVVVPKAAPLVSLSLLFQRHRKTELSEREGTASRIARNGASVYAAGSARTYSRRPRSPPHRRRPSGGVSGEMEEGHRHYSRGRGTRPGRPLCTNKKKKAKQKARENPTAQRRTRAPPSRSEGRGQHLAPRPHTLAAGWPGLAKPTTAVSPRFRQANLGIGTTSQRGCAGCRSRRPALGPAPRKGLPKEGPSATSPRACSSAVVRV